jgi:hypothetical protein
MQCAVLYWGYSTDLPTCSTGKCMCFGAVSGMAIAHKALCPFMSYVISTINGINHVPFMALCRHHCHVHLICPGCGTPTGLPVHP